MQAIHDIFSLWPTVAAFANDLKARPDTVRKWKKFQRIPQESWEDVISAAASRGMNLTVTDIIAANAPMKQRGRPALKIRGKRVEARAS